MYMHVHVFAYVFLFKYTCVHECLHACVHVGLTVRLHVCTCVHVCDKYLACVMKQITQLVLVVVAFDFALLGTEDWRKEPCPIINVPVLHGSWCTHQPLLRTRREG